MVALIWALLISILYVLLEHGCRETKIPTRINWFQLIQLEQLVVSKKARTRGDVDHHGRTRRQRAHS